MSAASEPMRHRWAIGLAAVAFLILPPVLIIWWRLGGSDAHSWIAALGQWLSAVFTAAAVVGAWLAYRAQSEQLRILRKEHSLENYKWRSDLINEIADKIVGAPPREGLLSIKEMLKDRGVIPQTLRGCTEGEWKRFIWLADDLYQDYVSNELRPLLGGPLERLGDAIRDRSPKLEALGKAAIRED